MESHDTGYLKLDQEFDRCLAEMKPHVLKLPHKTGILKQASNIFLSPKIALTVKPAGSAVA